MKLLIPCLLLMFLAACAEGPIPRYAGPGGDGRLVYEPGVGITRQGAVADTQESELFERVQTAFTERRYQDCILNSILLTDSFPDGARAVEGLLLRIRSRLEVGRLQDPSEGLPNTVTISQWMFLYLVSIHDERFQNLMRRDETWRAYIDELRALSVDEFLARVRPDANAIYNAGQLEAARDDCSTLMTYYLPALELREFRRQAAELTRDVAWLLYAAGASNAVISVAEDLGAMNPEPAIKADALFIQGHAQRLNGAHALAANTFGHLFGRAGLRDTDTRWRPYALMWQIHQTMQASKGRGYDVVPYEIAFELLGEYELYMIENPNIPENVHEQFVRLLEDVYNVMIWRERNAAETYSRIGEGPAARYHAARAEEREVERDRRVADLRRTP